MEVIANDHHDKLLTARYPQHEQNAQTHKGQPYETEEASNDS